MPLDEESGAPVLFPLEGDFSAVVPLSDVGDAPVSSQTAVTSLEPVKKFVAKGAADNRQDEHEEVTLVPGSVGHTAVTLRPRIGRPSWPVMIVALILSVAAGLTAGIYLIKSARPVEMPTAAAVAEDVSTEAAGATVVPAPQPDAVASESRLTPSPAPETDPVNDATNIVVDPDARPGKTARDLSIPKRGPTPDTPSGHVGHSTETPSARLTTVEKPSERPERKGPSVTSNTHAKREAVTTRRATDAIERPPVRRAPEGSLPVSTPPASAKSKRVIQWP
ncbi:MAG: hypothetical protein ACJ74Q_26690 [Pyrinomonadaceae bacterium]